MEGKTPSDAGHGGRVRVGTPVPEHLVSTFAQGSQTFCTLGPLPSSSLQSPGSPWQLLCLEPVLGGRQRSGRHGPAGRREASRLGSHWAAALLAQLAMSAEWAVHISPLNRELTLMNS